QKTADFALGDVDGLCLGAFGLLDNPIGFAARAWQDIVSVRFRLVARAFLVSPRPLDVIEGVDDRERRIDAKQLNLSDEDAGLIRIEPLLKHVRDLIGDLLTPFREAGLNGIS